MIVDIFGYLGIHDPRVTSQRVLNANAEDLFSRGDACTRMQEAVAGTADTIARLRADVASAWNGEAGSAALEKLSGAIVQRDSQAVQMSISAAAFNSCGYAIQSVQDRAHDVSRRADELERRVRDVANGASANFIPGKVLEFFTDVNIGESLAQLYMIFSGPARDLEKEISDAIGEYEQSILVQAEKLRSLPGIVDQLSGPDDRPGDEDLRRGALFHAVYGRYPVSDGDLLMASALDIYGNDQGLPNSNIVIVRIDPVPGAGIVNGAAFISQEDVQNVSLSPPGLPRNFGDNRGFDPSADPSASRVSFFVDYETGIVVVRQNPTVSDNGTAGADYPAVSVEQAADGSVRLRSDSVDTYAPQIAKDFNFSVREDIIINPHEGREPASVNGTVTRFPSWEIYQSRPGEGPVALLQQAEDASPTVPVPILAPNPMIGGPPIIPIGVFPVEIPDEAGLGPSLGLPLPGIEVGADPNALDDWISRYHPDQVGEGGLFDVANPATRGDRHFAHPLPVQSYPTVDSDGTLVIPNAPAAGAR